MKAPGIGRGRISGFQLRAQSLAAPKNLGSGPAARWSCAPDQAVCAGAEPNRAQTAFRCPLSAQAQTSIELVDLSRRLVRTLVNSQQKPGRYTLRWDGRDNSGRALGNGVYFCEFSASDYRQTEKLTLVR